LWLNHILPHIKTRISKIFLIFHLAFINYGVYYKYRVKIKTSEKGSKMNQIRVNPGIFYTRQRLLLMMGGAIYWEREYGQGCFWTLDHVENGVWILNAH